MGQRGDVSDCKASQFLVPNFMMIDIQELFGSHFELPELGPLGVHGLANARDFESPLASFDIDQSPWESQCLYFHILRALLTYNLFNQLPISACTVARNPSVLSTQSQGVRPAFYL